eukprot:symbB.v1.2.018495.t1/scaffold1403.1/size153157/1
MPSTPCAAGVKTGWGPVSRHRTCPPVSKACAGHSVNAQPVGATPPPWATHGPEVERNAPRKSGASPSRAQSVQVEHDFKLARSATKAFSSFSRYGVPSINAFH